MGIKFKTKLSESVEDGVHTGEIVAVEERTKPFNYIDFVVAVDGTKELKLKFGCPASISVDKENKPVSKLAKICKILDILAPVDKETNIELASNKKIQFQTITETTEAGTFARIILESVKLKK